MERKYNRKVMMLKEPINSHNRGPNQKQKIRIAFVISSNLREWGGMEHTLYEFYKHIPNDFDITIFQTDYNPNPRLSKSEIDKLFSGAKIKTFKAYFSKLEFLRSSRIGRILNETLLTPFLAILLRNTLLIKFRKEKNNFDIFYFFNSDIEPKIIGNKRATLIGSTHAWFPSVSNVFKKIELKLVENRLIMSNLDYFHFFPYQYSLLSITHRSRFFSLPNGVDSRKYNPGAIKSRRVVRFLFNARLEECKGVLLVLDAFKTLKVDMDISLDIVGSGVLSSIVELNASNKIRYHGFVSDEALYRIVRDCDILIYPSICDSFALVVLNSLSSGLHVITTKDISRNFEPFVEAGHITVIDISRNALITAMQKCANDIDVIRKDREIGYNIAVNMFDWEYVTSELYRIIRSIYHRSKMKVV